MPYMLLKAYHGKMGYRLSMEAVRTDVCFAIPKMLFV